MRKLLTVAFAVAGILAYRKWRETEEEKAVWSRETDRVD
ncbi:DLW-39 family protein [Zhihengliuella salsuginis]|nr:DLW-39 family protein [Zhihengliuella salsuginis]